MADMHVASQMPQLVKNLPASAGDSRDIGLLPRWGRSPGGGTGQSTSVFLPGEFHGQRTLAAYSPWGGIELYMTEHAQATHVAVIGAPPPSERNVAQIPQEPTLR